MNLSSKFGKLLEPGQIGSMTLKNRMVLPPMGTHFVGKDGDVTPQTLEYYGARAGGGVGLVIVEFTCVDTPEGKGSHGQTILDDDRFIPGMRNLAERIKRRGARAALQIAHIGRMARSSVTGLQPVAPSAIPGPGREMPRALTREEVRRLTTRFADAAVRAQKAGFDGVEIHGAHGYLISEFLSEACNRRTDDYGGTLENRARFLLEILRAIRERLGRNYPVWCRLNGVETGIQDGITIQETIQISVMCQENGADAIHVSVHVMGPRKSTPAPGGLLPLAEAVKKAVRIPVIAVGHIDPTLGEAALLEGKADFIAFGKAHLADPDYAGKIFHGRLEDIRPCIQCFVCLDALMFKHRPVCCTVNPALGKEGEYRLVPAARKKKILVIGGGPAGMEAARVSALRGHRVELWEKGDALGGQLRVARMAPHKQALGDLIRYLSRELDRAGVKVLVGAEATLQKIRGHDPEAVVLAAGASPYLPSIEGIGRSNVVPAAEVLTGKAAVGARVVVIGGELVGCEVADFLSEAGKKVTITEMQKGGQVATKVNFFIREPLVHRLSAKGVEVFTDVQYRRITAGGIEFVDRDDQEWSIPADTIVNASGSRANQGLLSGLQGQVPELHLAGDCLEPRNILEAMADGYRIGFKI